MHKLAWFKQFRNLQAREKALEDELKTFLLSNPSIAKERKREQQEQVSRIKNPDKLVLTLYALTIVDEWNSKKQRVADGTGPA